MEETNTGVKELTADSSTEEILQQSPDAQEEAKTSLESPTGKEPSDATGEVEKTQELEAGAESDKSEEEKEEEGLIQSKNPIPYERFSRTIQQRNEIKKEREELQEKLDSLYSDPDVLRVVLSKQGYNEQQIKELFTKEGIEDTKKPAQEEGDKSSTKEQLKDLVKDLDLSTTDGWLEANARIADFVADKKAKENLQQYDTSKSRQAEASRFIETQEKEAKKLCDDIYKIPYGESGKDEKNPSTAVGKIAKYLEVHPEDAKLGHVKLLRLALSEEGFKLGEQKGKEAEQTRLKKLKSAAIESDDVTTGKDEEPNAEWSTERILEYTRKHPDWRP